MMEGPRHQHLHQEWQEPLEEPGGVRLQANELAAAIQDEVGSLQAKMAA